MQLEQLLRHAHNLGYAASQLDMVQRWDELIPRFESLTSDADAALELCEAYDDGVLAQRYDQQQSLIAMQSANIRVSRG